MSSEKLEQYIAEANLEGLDALLSADPSLAKSHTGHHVSPLMLSCYYKKPGVTGLLLKYLDEISLFEAAAAGKFDVVRTWFTSTRKRSTTMPKMALPRLG